MMQVKYQDILIEILAFILENDCLCSQNIIDMKLLHIGAHWCTLLIGFLLLSDNFLGMKYTVKRLTRPVQ